MAGSRQPGRDDRAASEVISVVLMVAVTIVLAAMVGTVLLNIVSEVDTNPVAGASVSADAEDNDLTVTFTAAQEKGTTLDVRIIDTNTNSDVAQFTLSEVGQTETKTLSDGTFRVLVTAEAPDGRQAVVTDTRKDL